MYYVDKNTPLQNDDILRIIQKFITTDLPRLKKLNNYYQGKHQIVYKKPTTNGKPCNKVVVNYCKSIVDNYRGYICGIPVKYDCEELDDILNYNDTFNEDSEYLEAALKYGVAYEINYIDADGKQRYKLLDTRECIPVYDNTLDQDLVYVIRIYRENLNASLSDDWYVELYDDKTVRTFKSQSGFTSLSPISDVPHYYKQVPITVFKLNEDERGIFEGIISLNDAYNSLVSSEIDDWDSFADAYLVLKGMQADESELSDMRDKRILIMDSDADAHYLTKSISDTQIENMLTNINDQIYKMSECPDFWSDKFMSQSGQALKFKMIGFENQASSIVSNMTKALQRRIELICSVEALKMGEATWRDVAIVFTRNIPDTLTPSTSQELMQYRGLVADKILLSLLPFIKDPDEAYAMLKEEEQSRMSLYDFSMEDEEDETESPILEE